MCKNTVKMKKFHNCSKIAGKEQKRYNENLDFFIGL